MKKRSIKWVKRANMWCETSWDKEGKQVQEWHAWARGEGVNANWK